MLQLCVRSLRQKNLSLVMWTIQKRSVNWKLELSKRREDDDLRSVTSSAMSINLKYSYARLISITVTTSPIWTYGRGNIVSNKNAVRCRSNMTVTNAFQRSDRFETRLQMHLPRIICKLIEQRENESRGRLVTTVPLYLTGFEFDSRSWGRNIRTVILVIIFQSRQNAR
jgi:hypothetical protein